MSQPNRRNLEPLQTNDTATFLVGTALWAVALVILLILQPAERWWIWTCVAGVGGGLFGLWYVHRFNRPRDHPGPRTARRDRAPGAARAAEEDRRPASRAEDGR